MPDSLQQSNAGFFSGNSLKLIAALAMVIDHAGLMFSPNIPFFGSSAVWLFLFLHSSLQKAVTIPKPPALFS